MVMTTDMPAPSVTLHTDGACLGNPGPGGWAAILQWGEHESVLSGGLADTTNNQMELMVQPYYSFKVSYHRIKP